MKVSIKTITILTTIALIGFFIKSKFFKNTGTPNHLQIHFVIPLEHQALNDIVNGFKESLSAELPGKVAYNVHNAQGDPNLQRAILQKLAQEKVSLVVPVGTTTAQMALKIIKDKPLLSLAAMYSEADRKGYQVTGVLDEISLSKFSDFLTLLHTAPSTIVLIHSTDDRRLKDAIEMEKKLKARKIYVKRLMVQTLNDLYTISQNFPSGTHSVIMLKDHLIVSGISVLKKACDKKKIPLITSDEGSVKSGASMGFGVTEKDIGIKGGKMAAQILTGTPVKNIPIQTLSTLKVFINPQFLKTRPCFQEILEKICQQNNYLLVKTETEDTK